MSTITQTQTTAPTRIQVEQEQDSQSALTWDLSNTEPLHHIPTFTDKYAERAWAKGKMAAAFRICARLGWADGASGHVSLRDPVNPEHFWINPYAVHFAQMKASDLVLVDHEGKQVLPTKHKVNAAGFIIHSSIHKARPDINAAVHLHSPWGRAWSAFGKGIDMVNQGEPT
jgi:ribulose-5-phosphate 4-epimerase/fuculose-1-phosphate aldolase